MRNSEWRIQNSEIGVARLPSPLAIPSQSFRGRWWVRLVKQSSVISDQFSVVSRQLSVISNQFSEADVALLRGLSHANGFPECIGIFDVWQFCLWASSVFVPDSCDLAPTRWRTEPPRAARRPCGYITRRVICGRGGGSDRGRRRKMKDEE